MTNSEVGVCNKALSHLGQGVQLTSTNSTAAGITQTGQAAEQCKLHYDNVRDLIGQVFKDGGTTKIVLLSPASDDVVDANQPWRQRWTRCFAYPEDCLYFHGFVLPEAGGTQLLAPQIQWAIGTFNGETVIFTDTAVADAFGEYTQVSNPAKAGAWAISGHSKLLAAYMCPVLVGVSAVALALRDRLMAESDRDIAIAMTLARNESHPRDTANGSWVRKMLGGS